ncbi:unnamed protein product [Calypogeia fissa]
MLKDDTPENSDVEMTGIDPNELSRFKMWEKQTGRKQSEHSPGTPSHHQKISPATKKNRKSSGDLFPAPKDISPSWQTTTPEHHPVAGSLSDIAEGIEWQVEETNAAHTQPAGNIIFGTPGRRSEEKQTPPGSHSNRRTPAHQ